MADRMVSYVLSSGLKGSRGKVEDGGQAPLIPAHLGFPVSRDAPSWSPHSREEEARKDFYGLRIPHKKSLFPQLLPPGLQARRARQRPSGPANRVRFPSLHPPKSPDCDFTSQVLLTSDA